jgi:site-specific DNA-methyltransferase (adenine-specific)
MSCVDLLGIFTLDDLGALLSFCLDLEAGYDGDIATVVQLTYQQQGTNVINTLFYGDNLDILRNEIPDESVDLIYLDPPFNSNRNYNVLFKEKSGQDSPAQIRAFTDTWTWDEAARDAYTELTQEGPHNVATMIAAMREFVGQNDMMAYLVMMAQRLVELYRVLKPTGSIYLHCDSVASHYLKMLLDTVFGARRFRNEIIWKRTSSHGNVSVGYGDVIDVILYYSKGDTFTWNQLYVPYSESHKQKKFNQIDENGRRFTTSDLRNPGVRPNLQYEFKGYQPHPNGWAVGIDRMEQYDKEGRLWYPKDKNGRIRLKRYLNESPGERIQNLWTDIAPINSQAQERLGYPTQKPLALLERIIAASSNSGDVVLDPFCGCGTAVVAAQKLDRKWIGIDVTHLAISLMKNRLVDMFGETLQFEVHGTPEDVESARMLAETDRDEFQYWANSLVNAQPIEGKEKKGADRGIDGVIRFVDDDKEALKRVIIQVKSGHVQRNTMGELRGTIEREKAEMGILVTLEPSTAPMRQEAIEAGTYFSPGWGREFPRMQILTIEELLAGTEPKIPPMRATFQRAQRLRSQSHHRQSDLFGG